MPLLPQTDPYREVRNSVVCPLCSQKKGSGLLVCWPCFNQHDMRTPPREDLPMILDLAEARYRAIDVTQICSRCGISHDDPRASKPCASNESPSGFHLFVNMEPAQEIARPKETR